jgi:hypothetical protein
MRFEGTDTYVATPDLMLAVNAAVTLERPLLVKGSRAPRDDARGEVARCSAAAAAVAHQSTTKAQQGLYEYDAARGCETRSSATSTSPTSRITSSLACCGRHSNPQRRRSC